MFKYDILYAKPGQYTLLFNEIPINVSKHIDYLKEKLASHRNMTLDDNWPIETAVYKIIDNNQNILYQQSFKGSERITSKQAYYKETPKKDINYVKKGYFNLITDKNGNILTDEELLAELYNTRHAFKVMITNKAIVNLATFKPSSREEFTELDGLGEKIYLKCGKLILEIINKYKND